MRYTNLRLYFTLLYLWRYVAGQIDAGKDNVKQVII